MYAKSTHLTQITCSYEKMGFKVLCLQDLPEPPVRFELTTYALRVRCSTPELRWLAQLSIYALEF